MLKILEMSGAIRGQGPVGMSHRRETNRMLSRDQDGACAKFITMQNRRDAMEPTFKGTVEKAFRFEQRGTSIVIDPQFEGIVNPGDIVAVPLHSGEVRNLKVKGVEYMDSLHPKRFWIAVWVESLDPQEIVIGGGAIGIQG